MTRVLRFRDEAEAKAALGKRVARSPLDPHPRDTKIDWAVELRQQFIDTDIPMPVREFTFHPFRNWRTDLAWIEKRLAIEVDGAVHRTKERFVSDIAKHNELALAGWTWIRVTPEQVRNGEAMTLARRLHGLA